MNIDQKNDLIYSQVLIKKIVEHNAMFGIPGSKTELQLMPLSDYRDMSQREAYFYVDHNGFLRHQFSGEVLAANQEQVEELVNCLKELKRKVKS